MGTKNTKPRRNNPKGRNSTPKEKQARILARSTYQNISQIARDEGVSRGTVYRVRNTTENAMMLQAFRDEVLDIVPSALKGLKRLVKDLDRQAIIETLYGARVLLQRYEVQKVEDEPQRTYDYTRAEFFGKYGRLPLNSELEEFEKTLNIEPITKAGLIEP